MGHRCRRVTCQWLALCSVMWAVLASTAVARAETQQPASRPATGKSAFTAGPLAGPTDAALRTAVLADWEAQEKRLGRECRSPEAIRDAVHRGRQLLDCLDPQGSAPERDVHRAQLAGIVGEAAGVDGLSSEARLDLYRRARWLARDVALADPSWASRPVLFMKRHRFICQMLHEYLGYYYGEGAPLVKPAAGGDICVLERPGRSWKVRPLVGSRLPEGAYTTLALGHDGLTIYFAFCERAAPKPDYYTPRPGDRHFHLYAMDADGGNLRRLTHDAADDFDPCPLPDGGVAFLSTRRGGFGRCHNPWEPLPAYTLHRMDADGSNIRTLSFHETNEWHPSVLWDGRIVYSRWDYVDRSASNFHGLWASNPDGTSPAILFGNYTTRINACYQARPIPGSRKIAFIAGAHHAAVGGALVVVDPARVELDAQSGEDRMDAVEVLTPEVCFPEAPGWPACYYHSPWPLSEDRFLVSFSHDPLPGMSAKSRLDTETGIYYFDRFGNLELLYREAGVSCMYPMPLGPRGKPPTLPSALRDELGDEGELVLADVGRGVFPLPASRPIRQLRVYQVLPKTTHVANRPRLGYANGESARMLLGTVPVEADGSAYFRVPARKPLYFQAVDAEGRAVQTMRSVTYLQPGERRGCVGCHEPTSAAPDRRPLAATARCPSPILPGPDGSRPLGYVRLVQPVLDRYCVACHDGAPGPGKSRLALDGRPDGTFTRSYVALKPYLAWVAWAQWSPTALKPGQSGADRSPLTAILEDRNHAGAVKLDDEARRRLYLWLDSNVPFYGTYDAESQLAQQQGQAVLPPKVQ